MKSTAKQIGTLLLASAVLAGVVNLVNPKRIPWTQDWSHQVEEQARQKGIKVIPLVTAEDLFATQQALFVDARSAEEFNEGHIPAALNMPLESWDDHIMTLSRYIDAGVRIVVYCSNRTCDDALLLAAELKQIGAHAELFVDGYDGWKANDGEVDP